MSALLSLMWTYNILGFFKDSVYYKFTEINIYKRTAPKLKRTAWEGPSILPPDHLCHPYPIQLIFLTYYTSKYCLRAFNKFDEEN